MRHHYLSACFLALLGLLASAPASAEGVRTVTWLAPSFNPASRPVDGKPGDGMTDKVIRYMMAQWPDAEHRVQYLATKASWHKMEAGEDVCYVGAVRTRERGQKYYFRDTGMSPPLQVIMRPAVQAAVPLTPSGEVDLPRLITARGLRGLILDRRSYGSHVDKVVADAGPLTNLVRVSLEVIDKSTFMAVLAGRTDYVLEYDYTLAVAAENMPAVRELKVLPIAGNAAPLTAGIACPRTAWGKEVIARADRILGTPAGAQMLYDTVDHWLSPETRKRYERDFRNFYRALDQPLYPEKN